MAAIRGNPPAAESNAYTERTRVPGADAGRQETPMESTGTACALPPTGLMRHQVRVVCWGGEPVVAPRGWPAAGGQILASLVSTTAGRVLGFWAGTATSLDGDDGGRLAGLPTRRPDWRCGAMAPGGRAGAGWGASRGRRSALGLGSCSSSGQCRAGGGFRGLRGHRPDAPARFLTVTGPGQPGASPPLGDDPATGREDSERVSPRSVHRLLQALLAPSRRPPFGSVTRRPFPQRPPF